MRTLIGTFAKLIMLGLFFALTSATLVAPSYAGQGYKDFWEKLEQKYGDCQHSYGWSIKCKKTNIFAPHAPSSTGLFPSRCNGELGFWQDPIVFQNGETFCIARSTADFYHNDGYLGGASCTKTFIWFWDGFHKHQKTVNGGCPVHMSPPE
jgi:hypothetical protein